MLPQVDDRIAHQLTGAVVGDVSSTLHFEYLYATSLQLGGPEWEARGTGSAAQRDDRVMLHQEEQVLGDVACNAAAAEVPLELQNLGVTTTSQVSYQQPSGHALAPQCLARRPCTSAIT